MQPSLSNALDLSYFSCKMVNLSMAVVNEYETSVFTSPLELKIHQGVSWTLYIQLAVGYYIKYLYIDMRAPPPENFTYISSMEDLRPGFLGHAIANLKWNLPSDGKELAIYFL